MSSNRELELKFEMDVGELKALQRAASSLDTLEGTPVTRRLRSIYFDTPDFDLRRNGIALRVRDVDGQWVQTVKAGTPVVGGVSNPVESENAVDSPSPVPLSIPDPDLRALVVGISDEALLLPVFQTVVERSSYFLRRDDSLVELAVDMGHIYSDKGVDPIGEAELELKQGPVASLLDSARDLFPGRFFCLSSTSKAHRGYILIGADKPKMPEPMKPDLPMIGEDMAIEEAFVALFEAVVAAIQANWQATLRSEDPEGPHQLRVSLRLLRSLLKAFRHGIDGPALRDLDRRARDVGRLVGQLRDVDVLIEDVYEPIALNLGKAKRPAAKALADRLRRHRLLVRHQVLSELQHWPYASFQLELGLFTRMAPWQVKQVGGDGKRGDLKALSAWSLEHAIKKVQRFGDDLDELDLTERHDMRKKLKTLRYQSDLFGPLYRRGNVKPFAKKLKKTQRVFGYLNDVALGEHLPVLARSAGGVGPEDDRIIAKVMKKHEKKARKAWRKAQKRWKKFEKADPFWR